MEGEPKASMLVSLFRPFVPWWTLGFVLKEIRHNDHTTTIYTGILAEGFKWCNFPANKFSIKGISQIYT